MDQFTAQNIASASHRNLRTYKVGFQGRTNPREFVLPLTSGTYAAVEIGELRFSIQGLATSGFASTFPVFEVRHDAAVAEYNGEVFTNIIGKAAVRDFVINSTTAPATSVGMYAITRDTSDVDPNRFSIEAARSNVKVSVVFPEGHPLAGRPIEFSTDYLFDLIYYYYE